MRSFCITSTLLALCALGAQGFAPKCGTSYYQPPVGQPIWPMESVDTSWSNHVPIAGPLHRPQMLFNEELYSAPAVRLDSRGNIILLVDSTIYVYDEQFQSCLVSADLSSVGAAGSYLAIPSDYTALYEGPEYGTLQYLNISSEIQKYNISGFADIGLLPVTVDISNGLFFAQQFNTSDVYVIDTYSGEELQKIEFNQPASFAPVLVSERYVVQLASNGSIVVASRDTNEIVWKSGTFYGQLSTPKLSLDGNVVYFAKSFPQPASAHAYAFNTSNGVLLWNISIPVSSNPTPSNALAAVSPYGYVYITTSVNPLIVINSTTGSIVKYINGPLCQSQVITDANGVVYYADKSNVVHALSADGIALWHFNMSSVTISPIRKLVIGNNNTLYVVTLSSLHALTTGIPIPSPTPSTSPSPSPAHKHHDSNHNKNAKLGIGLGVGFAALVVILLVVWWRCRRSHQNTSANERDHLTSNAYNAM